MSTMAELGIAVHSESVDEATNSLNNMADAGGRAESAAVGVGTKWDQAGKKVAESAKTASTAIDDERDSLEALLGKIDPTVAAFARLDKQQQQLSKFKASGLLPADDFADYSSKIQQTRESLGRFSDSLGRTGTSAKQTAAALRGVPAQFTDIVVSLQGGQAPLTVLLQQGGQLKEMFGGVGNAAQALGGYIFGLVNPFTVAAAAVGALGAVIVASQGQFNEYNRALSASGNAAGKTADQLSDLATTLADGKYFGQANEAVLTLAQSGRLTGEAFEEVARAATELSVATGQSAADIADQLSSTKGSVTDLALEYSSKYGVITQSTYDQIKALEEQGDRMGAIKTLSGAVADEMTRRNKEMEDSTRGLSKAWAEVRNSVASVYNEIKNGLQASPEVFRLQVLQGQLESAQELGNKKLIEYYQQQITLAQQAVDAQQKKVALVGQEGVSRRAQLVEEDKWAKDGEKFLTSQQKMEKEIAAQRQLGLSAGKSQVEIEQRINEIRKSYEKNGPSSSSPVDLTGFNAAENALRSLEVTFQNSLKVLDASQKAGLINDQEYALQKGALLEKEKSDVQAAYQGEIAALEAVSAKSSTTSAQRIQVDQKIADARSKMVDALKKLDADQEVLSLQTQERLDKERQAIDAYAQALQDSLKRTQDSLDLQLAGFGLGDRSRQQLQEILKIRQEYEEKFDKLERDHRLKRISDNEYDAETKLLEQSLDQRLEMQQGYYDKEADLRSNWMNGASRAFANYIDETKDIAGQTEGLFSDALHGVEDAFVNAATTGKLSFKDLADSIIADLARIVAKAYIVTPILAALGIGGDPASGAGSSGGLGSLFGGGAGGGLGGALSNIGTVVSVAGSKFGESVLAGWNGSEGVVGGLQGAFSNGADYFKSVVTSAFETGSTTAASIFTSETTSAALTQGYSNYAAQFGTGVAGPGAFDGALSAAATQSSALTALQTLSATLGYIQGVYTIFNSFKDYGLKGGAVTAGAGAAGAYIGSFAGPLGTAAGFAIGTVLGSLGAGKLFGGGEKYADLSTSATGRYINGQYTDTGIQQGWQTKAPKFGDQIDSIMSANLNKFSATLGMLYDTLGNGADVVAYNLLQVRKTSGKYSGSYGAQLDDGNVLEFNNQFKAQDAAAAIADNYDNLMGTFLAKAIVSSKSLPNYFKAQFTAFASDWDTTADEVIKAIEGVFTRFNGVNDALKLINVNNLKLDETGLIASDSILNMIGAMSDLDTTTATAKEKVDALNTAVGTYYQAFFSADEQFADLTESLKNAFGSFGLELPDTRSAYRDMVEDIDVTTAAGQALFATLVGLAKNADSYYSTIDKQASDARQQMLSSSQSALERAINAQKASINDMLETASTSVSDLTNISTSLGNALKSLRGDSDSAVKTLRAQAQATLQAALAQARAGKSLAGFEGLDDALSVITGNTTDLYSSLEDFNRDQGRTANVVAELEKLNGKQLSSAEKTVAALQAQLKSLDAQLEFEQAQLDALNGVDTSVKSVAQAVKEMNAAVVAALASMGGKGTPTNNGTFIDSIYKDVLGLSGGADQAGKDYWLGELANGHITLDQLAQAIANAAKENHQWVKPGYATGGYISGPGTGTSDSIIARLSNGEYVMTAAAVSTYGTDMLDRMNNLQIPQFASGGAVMNVASPVVVGSQRPKAGNDAGDGAEALRQLNKRLGNIETYLDNASRDLRQMNNAGVQVVGTVSTKEVA
jgi:lambda family phage tail tape measure protein